MDMNQSKYIILLLLLGFLVSCAGSKSTQKERESGIIYGPGFALSLTAPEGWELKEDVAQSKKLFALMLPKGETWESADSKIYASVAGLDTTSGQQISTILERDSLYFTRLSERVVVQPIDSIQRPDSPPLLLRKITGTPEEPYKVIAYAEQGPIIVMIGFGTKTGQQYSATLPKFYDVLRNYRYFDRETKFLTPDELNPE